MTYVVAVRAMCEFTAKRGDLDLRFTPAPTSLEGMAGHLAVAGRRASGYQTEITLTGTHRGLTVRGRADGFYPLANRLEEIKTCRGDLTRMPDNHRTLHWAQARVYGHLLCRARGLAMLTVALVYFDIGTQKETLLEEFHTARDLEIFFVEQCERFLDWAVQEEAHRAARNAALGALQFPHGQFRSGQRELAVSVYRAARDGKPLMAQAPTGIGKTLATIFPLLKACAEDQIERIFFLTAKTPGRALALDAIDTLHRSAAASGSSGSALPLRTLELVARDKACEHPDKACNGESCPLALGFYDRLDAARSAALAGPKLDRAAVREVALAHEVCPYYLAQELARWGRRGGRRLQLLLRQQRDAVRAHADQSVARRRAGGRGAQSARPGAAHVQRVARSGGVAAGTQNRAGHVAQAAGAPATRVERAQACADRNVSGLR
ncbi:hypothetical protein GGD41_003857 [Paraburkholderia bryophila]|uniref:Helicase ATP-binding domain-containing protein n=1 Tax=Paraburkholderia bryophila TaxID=420952 RepID=A0A7Y9W9E0_9BURK|nr:hypothetical protein [Paraburkholderia bryophila]